MASLLALAHLVLALVIRVILGLLLWGSWLTSLWSVLSVRILLVMLIFGLLLVFWMRMTLLWIWLIVPIFGLMVVGKCALLVGLRLLVRVCVFPALEASLLGSVWGVSEEYGDDRSIGVMILCLSLALCSLFSALSSGVLFWLFRLTILVTWY